MYLHVMFETIAYVLNYIHKGHDVAYVEFKQLSKTKDEIKLYKYGRVMTSDESHCNKNILTI